MFSWETLQALKTRLIDVQEEADRLISRTSFNASLNHYGGYQEAILQDNSLEDLRYLLLTRKINPNYNRWGFNALSSIASSPSTDTAEQEEKIRVLFQYRVNVNSQATELDDRTPLQIFIVNQNPQGAIFFIYHALQQKIPIDFEIKDRFGCTALLLATKTAQQDIATCILQQRSIYSKTVDIDAQDCEHRTALDYAFILGQGPLIELLLSHKAKTNVIKDCTSLEKYHEHTIRKILLSVGLKPDHRELLDAEKHIYSKTLVEKIFHRQLLCREIYKLPKTNAEHSMQQSASRFQK